MEKEGVPIDFVGSPTIFVGGPMILTANINIQI
jgi:hypothetical protein